MSKTIKTISHPNAELAKINNSQAGVIQLDNENYLLEFKILSDDLRPRATHQVFKNKIVVTSLQLSEHGAYCLMLALQKQLLKDGIIKEIKNIHE